MLVNFNSSDDHNVRTSSPLRYFSLFLFTLLISACSSSNNQACNPEFPDSLIQTPPTLPTAPSVGSRIEASRFLAQSTFGANQTDITRLVAIGYNQWLAGALKTPFTSHEKRIGCTQVTNADRQEAFFHVAVEANDQLRQRVAYALGQIFVISDENLLGDERTLGMTHFHDLLAAHAFGNFRDLLEAVTLHPLMGEYLGMMRSEKLDPTRMFHPDESYAQHVMEIFTIGPVELSMDGSSVGIFTYDQPAIENLARVFTGWNYAGSTTWDDTNPDYYNPMEPNEAFRDTNSKTILGGIVLAAGQSAVQDLDLALDTLFNHANVAPFISKQLIQQLVTSNPSPAYIARVAQVFVSDENGARGNLASVLRAILLDDEARTGHLNIALPNFGTVREPLLRQVALWRAFSARAENDRHEYDNPELDFGQAFQRAFSTLNFFRPDFAQPGQVTTASIVSPEFQIFTEETAATSVNRFFEAVLTNNALASNPDSTDVIINLEFEETLAGQPASLVDHLNELLMGGQMSSSMRQIVIDLVTGTPMSTTGTERVVEAIFSIITSPEYAIQR